MLRLNMIGRFPLFDPESEGWSSGGEASDGGLHPGCMGLNKDYPCIPSAGPEPIDYTNIRW
jgi:hypothetical protein